MVDKADMKRLMTSRFQVEHELPLEFTQLLDKLIDVPATRANSVQRIPRIATEVTDDFQQANERRCSA